MASGNKKIANRLEKLTAGLDEHFGENTKSEHSKFSYNSFRHPEKNQIHPNLYKFEIVSELNNGPVFSFWSQPKTFEWNFNQKNRSQDCQDERNILRKEK